VRQGSPNVAKSALMLEFNGNANSGVFASIRLQPDLLGV